MFPCHVGELQNLVYFFAEKLIPFVFIFHRKFARMYIWEVNFIKFPQFIFIVTPKTGIRIYGIFNFTRQGNSLIGDLK